MGTTKQAFVTLISIQTGLAEMHWIISDKSKSNQIVVYPHLVVFSSG